MLAALASFTVRIYRRASLTPPNDSEPMTCPQGTHDGDPREPTNSLAQRMARGALVIALLTLSACSAFTSDEPPISDSTMVEVLIELHLVTARLELQYDHQPAVRDSILFKYGLDAQRFQDIMAYYADHPEAYSAIYTTMLDRISAERLQQGEGLPPSTLPPPTLDNDGE